MNIEQAALPKSVTLALLKALYAIVAAVMQGSAPAPSRRKELQTWVSQAGPAIKRFSLSELPLVASSVIKGDLENLDVTELGNELKGAFSALKEEVDVTADSLATLRLFSSWFRAGSERAYNNLAKTVSHVGDQGLSQDFVGDRISQKPADRALKAIVKAVAKRSGNSLTAEEAAKLKARNLELFKEYNRLRKEFNGAWKHALQTFVRESGKRLVDYQSVVRFLEQEKLEFALITGFVGQIDDLGKLYTKSGKLINGVPNPHMFPTVVMNPKYNPGLDDSYVFLAKKADGTNGNFFYTAEYKHKVTKEKFGNVSDLSGKIKSLRNKWVPALKAGIEKQESVLATMLEILLQHSARIGSRGNGTDGKPTFGLSTLQVKHVTIRPSGEVMLSYKGKDGVAQKHTIKPSSGVVSKQVAANLAALIKGKKPTDPLFTFVSGTKFKPVVAGMVNRYFKSLGAGAVTVHKLRTLRGTMVFQDKMDELFKKLGNKKPTEKQARELFLKLAKDVGKILGHIRTAKDGSTAVTGGTALQAYIDPSIQIQYWARLGMRPPKYLEKFR